MIPEGIPTIVVQVKNGKGGPNKDSIPVYDRIPPGSRVDYLKNGTLIRIVDPAYVFSSKYRKTWNNSTYVDFIHPTIKDDVYCEENGHLVPFIPEIGEGEVETYQVISDHFAEGTRTIQLRKA
jgi:hypothetical protein